MRRQDPREKLRHLLRIAAENPVELLHLLGPLRGKSAQLVLRGLVIALAIGMIGGFLPALRAARLPVTTSLREL